MQLSIGDEKHSLSLCAFVAGLAMLVTCELVIVSYVAASICMHEVDHQLINTILSQAFGKIDCYTC